MLFRAFCDEKHPRRRQPKGFEVRVLDVEGFGSVVTKMRNIRPESKHTESTALRFDAGLVTSGFVF